MEIDYTRAMEYLGLEVKRLQLDISVKNAFIDQQEEKINFLEDKLKKYDSEEKQTRTTKKEY